MDKNDMVLYFQKTLEPMIREFIGAVKPIELTEKEKSILANLMISFTKRNMLIGKNAAVTKISDGTGYPTNDQKYIGRAYNQVVKLVALVPDTVDFYITDFFIPEYINKNNDYIHYGFLKVSSSNITLLEEN